MHILRLEHPIRDFETWKAAFDRDPVGRQQSDVRYYRISRSIDNPNYIMVDLEFDSSSEAEAVLAALWRNVWGSQQAASALLGSPQARIVEAVEITEC